MVINDVQHALELLEKHEQMVENFYNDPMTAAMGVPTGDFQSGFDVKEREILSYLVKNADEEVKEMALERFEKFFP
jgi:hypothetical protein